MGQSIAKALGLTIRKDGYIGGNGYIVSWCVGHLVGLANAELYSERYAKWTYDDLPIIPEEWKTIITPGREKQFIILRGLMNDPRITGLVCATDAGREGELIFRYVYEMAGCKKPFERLWISSMEDEAIREGFANLKQGAEYDSLYHAAYCRAKADWLVGINASRLFSTLYHQPLSVGRVQTPTLAMIVERQESIRTFQKEPYYHARLKGGGVEASTGRIADREEAERIRAGCDGKQAGVVSVRKEQKTTNPPMPYDLTTLQREANRLYGYTAQQTLDAAQSLYEGKLITYPRTDSQYLPHSIRDSAATIIMLLFCVLPFSTGGAYSTNIDRILDDEQITDHHAIIPTGEVTKIGINSLPKMERDILILIAVRLLCASGEHHKYEATTTIIECEGHSFTMAGNTVVVDGWKKIERSFREYLSSSKKEGESETPRLPPLAEGQVVGNIAASVTEHATQPPKPYTEDTILAAMETAGNNAPGAERRGIGTPATRAAILERLIHSGFLIREGKNLLPTDKGVTLISIMPDSVKSPQLTADWEMELARIAKRQQSPDVFMNGIVDMIRDLVRSYAAVSEEERARFAPVRESIGNCPRCGGRVVEGKLNFYCENRDCQFAMWKDDRFFTMKKKTLTKQIASALLRDGKVPVKGLYSVKTGKTYDATLLLDDTGIKYVNYKLNFDNGKG